MPIVEAVAQQIISAEAEVDTMDMTYANGTTNPALELEENISECEAAVWKSTKVEGYSNGTAQAVCDIENEKQNSELSQSERQYRNKKDHMICKIMCLCVAYSSTIGGLTTITGTSTNLIFAEQFNTLKEMFQCGKTKSPREQASAQVIKEEYKKLGSISPLISWKEFQACMPWEIAILVGGGFALADGCEAEAIHVNPLYILIPTTLCTSFAFLLPVANPPNAIVFSYGHLKVIDMVKAGLGINIIGVAVVMLAIMTWAQPMFKLSTYPAWAPVASTTNISVH
ncbi:Solute carrier family 13 member 1, partial [Ophiophagus hannah]